MNYAHLLANPTPLYFDWAMLLFRVAFGLCFIVHAAGKLGLVGPGNMTGFVRWLKSLHFPFPEVQARIAMLTELLGGTLLACGLITRLAALMLFFAMAIAASFGHKGGGYLITNNPPGNEYALNLAILMVVLILLGPGSYSLDAILFVAH